MRRWGGRAAIAAIFAIGPAFALFGVRLSGTPLVCNPDQLPDLSAVDAPQPRDETRVRFARVVIDAAVAANGHKPKAIADIDGDGFADIVTYTLDQGLFWHRYPAWERRRIHGQGNGEIAQAADVDNDGDVDILSGGYQARTRWYENPRNAGGLSPAADWREHELHGLELEDIPRSHDTVVADVDGDGRVDVANEGGIAFQEASGGWAVVGNAHFPDRAWHGTAFGDVLGDGHPDLFDLSRRRLVWYENPLSAGGDPRADIWPRHAIGPAFEAGPDGVEALSITLADLDGDGRDDVLLANNKGGGGLSWLQQPADPRTDPWPRHSIDPTVNWVHQSSILTGDVDGDGAPDAVVAEQEQSPTHRLLVYYNDRGNGSVWTRQVLSPNGGHNPKLGDIDADGDLDLLNANHGHCGAANPIELWRNG
ncbi:MAG: FG-GAP repeat domain-containing protein [Dongiaceae bacterium]